ncbi:protein BCL9 homolog isoform X3 [Aethina tumida]|uniref:protein BCL9 homolog isoform X3 n=1 Tax=Aethina tumida TaxID=116153 RepID=UPI00214864CE|nr:protein BCL9 homolog isoform X3 [Aethina tumida]
MIKEKHEKGSETVKEEASSSDKESASGDVRVKKEEDAPGIKKEPDTGPITKNGTIIGSTNTGSLQSAPNRGKSDEDSVNVPASDTGSLPLKTEECVDGDLGGDSFPLGLSGSGAPPEGVQPLASNVISKQQSSMEVHYMQQQSQIFVFSTMLANSGADEVMQGRYPSIIAYHCAQPGTKKYLEKNPLKVTQFNRQSPAQWLNNFNMMKNKGCTRSPGLGPKSAPSLENFLGPEGLDDIGLSDGDLAWDQKNNHPLEGLEAGVKVPDENLTPQQRQHREESLATIRKMQQLFFPESQSIDGAPQGQPPTGPPDPNAMPNMPPNHPNQQPPMQSQQVEWQKMQSQYYDDKKKPPCGGQVPIGPVSGGGTGGGGGGGAGGGPNMPVPPAGAPGGTANAVPTAPRGVPGATGPRLQGPPPPYHQTPRSASVPIALQSSPSPASPNNPTSNLSLPSPRASSALNSPADPNRQFGLTRHMSTGQSPTSQDSPSAPRLNHSNPGTPLSSHMSPSVTSTSTEPTSTHQSSVDGMFGRTLQSMAQQKQQMSTSTTTCSTTPSTGSQIKEPNLMPVPSPQQIQYLNTFEGQELIIQKQPNTSLKEGNIISPPVLATTMDSGFPGSTPDLSHNRVSGPNTPTSIDVPRFPPTPGVPPEGCRFSNPSPHTPTTGDKPRMSGPGQTSTPGLSPQTVPGPNSDPLKNDLFPTPSPHMMDVQRFPGPNASPGAKIGGAGFVNVSPQGKPSPMDLPNYGCARGDNVPLNPNCTSTMSGNPKVSQFDPISSLTQMSQQLTNSVASSLNGQGNQGPAMMNFGSPSMHMMDMGGCHGMGDMDQGPGNMGGMPMQGPPHGFHPNSPMGPMCSLSPKLPGAFPNHMPMPRMMGRPPGPNPYNGANVQVKPNAPNTIQYLPAKPQVGQAPGPRGPPSLDFLTRLATPMNMMDNKMPNQNMQYFPNCGPNNGPMQGGPMPPHMGHMDGPMPQDGPMGGMGMGPMGGHMGNGAGPMMGGNMGMPGGMMPMMRGPMRPPMMRLSQMGYNGPGPAGGPEQMFNPGPPMGNPNAQMFVSGPKGSPMGMGAPDASQPLPPSMGQNNSFKNSPFVGPTTADPNYAQQFHNFQQQLYATSTRSQMGGQAMGPGPGPGPPHMQQPPYFNPK